MGKDNLNIVSSATGDVSYWKKKFASYFSPEEQVKLSDIVERMRPSYWKLFFGLMRKKDNRSVLNHIYSLAVEQYEKETKENNNVKFILKTRHRQRAASNLSKYTIAEWAILCHQSKETIEELIKKEEEKLVEQHASYKIESVRMSYLKLACQEGLLEVAVLLTGMSPNLVTQKSESYTPLHYAAARGHIEVVKYLLDHGADINAQDENHNKMPLHLACANGHAAVAELLITRGAFLYPEARDEVQPLHLACEKGLYRPVQLLINGLLNFAKQNNFHKETAKFCSETINKPNASGETPLYLAVKFGHSDIVSLLIKNGAQVNKKVGGETPLHIACRMHNMDPQSNYAKLIQILLANGANPKALDNEGEKPKAAFSQNGKSIQHYKLLRYSDKLNRSRFSPTLFSHSSVDDYHKQKEAADAVCEVVFNGAAKSSLDSHREVIANDEKLNRICTGLRLNNS